MDPAQCIVNRSLAELESVHSPLGTIQRHLVTALLAHERRGHTHFED